MQSALHSREMRRGFKGDGYRFATLQEIFQRGFPYRDGEGEPERASCTNHKKKSKFSATCLLGSVSPSYSGIPGISGLRGSRSVQSANVVFERLLAAQKPHNEKAA